MPWKFLHMHKRHDKELGTVAHTHNPSYSGARDQTSWAKSYQDPISTNKWGMVGYICNPSCAGRIVRMIMVPGPPGDKSKTISKK
jgi:hypothetical protein